MSSLTTIAETAAGALIPVLAAALRAQLTAARRHDDVRRELRALRRQVGDLRRRVDRWSHLP